MNGRSRTALLSITLLIAAGAQRAGAQMSSDAATFTVTSIVESAAGKLVVHEGLSLERAAGAERLELASTDGTTFSQPIRLTARGEIASNSQDGAVTCYNMAMSVIAHTQQAASDPPLIFVRFGSSVVPIPLALRATQTHAGIDRRTWRGVSNGVYTVAAGAVDAGVIINATIDERSGTLRGAAFDEVHYLGTPAHVVAHSTCILSRTGGPSLTRV